MVDELNGTSYRMRQCEIMKKPNNMFPHHKNYYNFPCGNFNLINNTKAFVCRFARLSDYLNDKVVGIHVQSGPISDGVTCKGLTELEHDNMLKILLTFRMWKYEIIAFIPSILNKLNALFCSKNSQPATFYYWQIIFRLEYIMIQGILNCPIHLFLPP